MKPILRSLLALTGSSILAISSASAVTLTWDANGATASQTDGTGAWDTATELRWWDGATNVDWTSGDNAIFGNGGAGAAVTLTSPTTIGSLKFNYFTGTYTLGTAGQEITLNSGIIKDSNMGHTQANGVASVASITSSVTLGAAQTWLNNSTNLDPKSTSASLIANGGTNLNGFALTIDGIGTTSFQGTANIISGSGGIVKNGTGVLLLGGANTSPLHTYTGGTTINGGIVRFNSIGTPGTSGAFGAGGITINNGIIEGYFGQTFARSLGTDTNQIQILGGTSGFSGQGGTSTTFQIGTLGSTLQWGSTHFFPTGGTLVLQSAAVNASGKMTLNNGIDLNGATRTITSLGGDTSGGATVTGAIIDSTATASVGLNKTGYGNLILQGNNTYTGATSITGGSWVTSNTTVAQGGWLTLSGTNGALSATSGISLNGATLQLINTSAQVAVDRVNNAANFTVSNGGGITWNNASGNNIAYAETLGSVSVSSGQFNIVLTNNQTGTGTSEQTLTLGGLSRSGSSTLTFSAGGTGPQAAGNKNMIVVTGSGTTSGWTDGASSNSIIGAYATTGTAANAQTDYAVYSGNYVVAANTVGSAENTWTDSTKAYTTSAGGTVTLAGTRTITALRNIGATTVLTLASGADLRTTGILNGAATLLTIDPGTGGTLSTPSGGDLYLTAGSGGITINAAVTNGGGTTNIVKSGFGNVTLTAADNTFGGNIVVNAGTLQIGSSTATQLSGGTYNGNIYIAAGAAFTMQSNSSNTLGGVISGDGNLNLLRGSTTLSGDNTYTGKTTLGLIAPASGGSNTVTVSKFNSVFTDAGLGTVHSASSSFGAPVTVANGTIDFGGGVQTTVTLNYTGNGETTDRVMNFVMNGSGSRVIDSSGGANALLKFTSAAVSNGTTTSSITLQGSTNGEFVQGLGFGFTNLTKSGAGTWTLGGPVGNTGITTVSANGGILALQKKSSLLGGNTANWTAAKIIVNSGGTLALNVGGTDELNNTDVTLLLGNLGGLGGAINNNGLRSGSTIGFDTTNSSGGSFTIADNLANATGTGSGAIGLTKFGTGTLILSGTNSYTGATNVNGGILTFANVASKSSGSAVTAAAAGTVGLGVKTSDAAYYSATNVSDLFNDNNLSGFTLNASSGVAIDTTNAGGSFDQTVALTGTRALTKLGTGTLILSQANTYTGATTVSGGKLAVNGSITSAVTVQTGATLQGSGSITGAVTVQSGGFLSTGNSIESLTITGNLTQQAGSTFAYEINNDAALAVAGDLTAVSGDVTLGSGALLTLTELGTSSWGVGEKLTLLSYTGSLTGLFTYNSSTLADDSSFEFSGATWQFNYNDTVAGSNYTGDLLGSNFVTMTVIPEPKAALLGALGVLLLLRRRR